MSSLTPTLRLNASQKSKNRGKAKNSTNMRIQNISSTLGKLSLNDKEAPVNPKRFQSLENTILNLFEGQHISEKTFQKIKNKTKGLEEILFKYFPDQPTLKLYGSAVNGLGNNDSDVDISLKVNLNLVNEKNSNEVLEKVKELVIQSDGNSKPEFIAKAKFPIVTSPNWRGIEIDISYNNWSAIENTCLLAAYCNWAPNILPQLGFLVKKWAKGNKICGVEGYFKSFHWMLLVIYYLQRVGLNGRMRKYQKNRNRCVPFIQHEFWDNYTAKPWKYFKSEPIPNWSNNKHGTVYHFYEFLKFYTKFPFKYSVIQIITPENTLRRLNEYNDAVVLRDPFFMGRRGFKNLSPRQKKNYRRVYDKPNITGMITQAKLDEMLKVMEITIKDIDSYIQEGKMIDPVMKRLFNI